MPQIPMSPEQLKEIVDYLLGLASAPAPNKPVSIQPAAKPEDFE